MSPHFRRLIAWAAVALPATASARPILEYGFNGSGTTSTSTGSAAEVVTFFNAAGVATDLHGAAGSGVSGLAGDRAFDNTATAGLNGGIARNTTFAGLQGFTSWTISGWYKREASGTAPTGGVALFMSPDYFSNAGGLGETGFAARWANSSQLRASTSGANRDSNTPTHPVPAGVAYNETDKWVFFAITYDGTTLDLVNSTPISTLSFYRGYRDPSESGLNPAGVELIQQFGNTPDGVWTYGGGNPLAGQPVTGPVASGNIGFAMGNRTEQLPIDPQRAFDGWLDNIRIYGSTTDTTGALGLSDLEALRLGDLAPVPEPQSVLLVVFAAATAGFGFRDSPASPSPTAAGRSGSTVSAPGTRLGRCTPARRACFWTASTPTTASTESGAP